ncbi:C-C motif chemokine 20-like [Polypterus senegalus]|uniref:C-C motif chemokine 20-like n=1 Tax=Polypterus senegalus TaxID=55291 RepID=UPI001965309D|nr:C-C motif chemokine 20-like [Polypterus senegalus]
MPRLIQGVLIFIIFTSCTAFANNYRRPSKITTNCCTSVSAAKVPYTIKGCRQQNALGPCVQAVIFYTKETGSFCADPKAPWVKQKVRMFRNKKAKSGKTTSSPR